MAQKINKIAITQKKSENKGKFSEPFLVLVVILKKNLKM